MMTDKPPEEALERLYASATHVHRDLWKMTQGHLPWSRARLAAGRTAVRRIEETLRSSIDDYDGFMQAMRAERARPARRANPERYEALYRNLADVQQDLIRTLAKKDRAVRRKLHADTGSAMQAAIEVLCRPVTPKAPLQRSSKRRNTRPHRTIKG